MICEACAAGADLAVVHRQSVQRAADEGSVPPGPLAQQVSADMHAMCKGGTWCDCQHGGTSLDLRTAQPCRCVGPVHHNTCPEWVSPV